MNRRQFECEDFRLDRMSYDSNAPEGSVNEQTHPHFHYFWEIKVFRREPDESPEIILTPPQIVHGETPVEWLSEGWVVHFQEPDISISVHGAVPRDRLIPYEKVDQLCPGGLKALLNEIKDCLKLSISPQNREKRANACLRMLWSALVIAEETSQKSNALSGPSLTLKARRYIERHYYRSDLSVVDVAKNAGVSSNYLANMFHFESLGSIRQYLVKTRLDNAVALLKSGRYTVKETAQMTGWRCPFYFSNTFKRHYGVAPSQIHKLKNQVYVSP